MRGKIARRGLSFRPKKLATMQTKEDGLPGRAVARSTGIRTAHKKSIKLAYLWLGAKERASGLKTLLCQLGEQTARERHHSHLSGRGRKVLECCEGAMVSACQAQAEVRRFAGKGAFPLPPHRKTTTKTTTTRKCCRPRCRPFFVVVFFSFFLWGVFLGFCEPCSRGERVRNG